MLVLHALYSGKAEKLLHWLEICPRNQFTTLDTHDGIGVVDVKDLLTQEEVDFAVEALYEKGANLKRIYSSEAYNNLDIYQINCTYYSALGNNDAAYLLARAIQCFTPGIPQIYYVGLLAGENDLELLENSKEGRNINRHYYSLDEINQEIERPVVKDPVPFAGFPQHGQSVRWRLGDNDARRRCLHFDVGHCRRIGQSDGRPAYEQILDPTPHAAAGDEQIF